MKRTLIAAALLLVASAAFAFNPKPASTTPRIAVLRVSQEYGGGEGYVADAVVHYLRDELRERGLDAYDAGLTYEQVADGEGEDADYYVEIAGAAADSGSYGGIGVGTYDIGVSVDLVVSHVAAELRIYDGRTGKLIRSDNIAKRKSAVMPTSVYIGGSRAFAALAVPFVRHAQYRNITRSAARDAAQLVAAALNAQQ
jgi:hypothetical protein